MRRLIMFIFLFMAFDCWPQETINYHHKLVFRELKKIFKIDVASIDRMDLMIEYRPSQKGGYFKVFDNLSHIGYCYIGRVNSCRSGGCSISHDSTPAGAFEYFDYLISMDLNKEVKSVKVYNYQATHGQEVCSRGWLKQFVGYRGNAELVVGKDIDAIAGATISVYAITIDVEQVVSGFQTVN